MYITQRHCLDCKHFSSCGSCVLPLNYQEQLTTKSDKFFDNFENIIEKESTEIFTSPDSHYRNRIEFNFFRTGEEYLNYSMKGLDKRPIIVDSCSIVNQKIFDLMPKLLEKINENKILKTKLFSVEFLATNKDKVLVTLLYHRKIDEEWSIEGKKLQKDLGIKLIGRSRRVKLTLEDDTLLESVSVKSKEYLYHYVENSFTQPNGFINSKMITWAKENSKNNGGDLLELYCGLGNFTIALSENFEKVLATEISKISIKTAKESMALNNTTNIDFLRMSSEDFTQALNGVREFTRVRESGVELQSYNFTTVLVDPPRAGLDIGTIDLIKKFKNIIYVSCNPETLKRDLEILTKTHTIEKSALFDQFPYTNHIESGVILKGKDEF